MLRLKCLEIWINNFHLLCWASLNTLGTIWLLRGSGKTTEQCTRLARSARVGLGRSPSIDWLPAFGVWCCLTQGMSTHSAIHIFNLLCSLNSPHFYDLLSFLLQPGFKYHLVLLFLLVLFLHFALFFLVGGFWKGVSGKFMKLSVYQTDTISLLKLGFPASNLPKRTPLPFWWQGGPLTSLRGKLKFFKQLSQASIQLHSIHYMLLRIMCIFLQLLGDFWWQLTEWWLWKQHCILETL